MLPSIAVPPLPGSRLKAGEEPPGRDSRPFPTAFLQVHGHIRNTYPVPHNNNSLVLKNICNKAEDRGGRKPSKCPESATPILRTVLHPPSYQALLKNSGGQVLGRHWSASTLPPSPAASCTGVHLRNVRAYIIFDCPRGIFADNHSALYCNSAGSEQAVGDAEGDGAAVGVDVQEQVVVIGDKSVRTLKSEADVAGKVLDVRDDSGCAAVLV